MNPNYNSILNSFDISNKQNFLALTYEFDDAEMLGLIFGKSTANFNDLRLSSPIVFYDASKTREFSRLPMNFDFRQRFKPGGIHHSKAFCFLTDNDVHLIFGSFNITHTGIYKNRETFTHFVISEKKTDYLQLLISFKEFLEKHYRSSIGDIALDNFNLFIEKLNQRVDEYGQAKSFDTSPFQLIDSGYDKDNSGFDKLRTAWKKTFSDLVPESMLVISPFFDLQKNSKLIIKLREENLLAREITFVSDINHEGIYPISKEFSDSFESEKVFFYQINKVLDQNSNDEWNKTLQGAVNRNIKINIDEKINRNLHSKILILSANGKSLVYIGSANFTTNAWLGKNEELGIITLEEMTSFSELKDSLLGGISQGLVEWKSNDLPLFETLSKSKNNDPEDETPFISNKYPREVDRIELVVSNDNYVHFNLYHTEMFDNNPYSYFWGEEELEFITVNTKETKSNEIETRKLYQLARNSTLKFIKDDDFENPTFFRFIYNKDTNEIKHLLRYKDDQSWLDEFIYHIDDLSYDEFNGENKSEKDDDNSYDKRGHDTEIDRESNLSIKMQRYVTLLPAFEASLKDKFTHLATLNFSDFEDNIMKYIFSPLRDYVKLVLRSDRLDDHQFLSLFKIGEILQIINKLLYVIPMGAEFSSVIISEKNELLKWFLIEIKGEDYLQQTPFKEYLTFIKGLK